MSPAARRRAAWILLCLCVVGWPATSLTFLAQEPQGVLGLSWLALILNAANILATTDVREKEDER